MIQPLTLDGALYEGGGAILRVALALSQITQKPFRIINIRANRKNPGLKQQHMVCIRALQELTGAKCTDARVGSTELLFIPGEKCKKSLEVNAVTAASITLILQALVPVVCFQKHKVQLTLHGGTDVPWSPSLDYFSQLFAHTIDPLASISMKLLKRGYYPKGQGEVQLTITPHQKQPLKLTERGRVVQLIARLHASLDLEKAQVLERIAQALKTQFSTMDITSSYMPTASTGCGITLIAANQYSRLGVSLLGEKHISAEKLGELAAKQVQELLAKSAPLDEYLADQLIIYLALCGGAITTIKITQHTHANIMVCEKFLPIHFRITKNTIRVEKEVEKSY